MKCLIYVRDGAYGPNKNLQLSNLIAFAEAKRLGAVRVFDDSGSGDDRPALQELLYFAQETKRATVLIWSLDRIDGIANSIERTVNLISKIGISGGRFISLSDSIDSFDHGGELCARLVAAINSARRSIKGERIHKSLAKAKLAGERIGRKRIRNDEYIHQLRTEGKTIREIAAIVGLSTWTIHASLTTSENS